MNWSDRLPFYEVLKKRGSLKPADEMPVVSEGDVLLMNLFSELSTSRSLSMGVGPIPAVVFWQAQERYGLTDMALSMLHRLDMEFVKQNASKS